MKGIRKLSLLALGLVFVAGIAACSGNSNNSNNSDNNSSDSGNVTPDPIIPPTPDPEPEDPETEIPEYVEMDELASEIGDLSVLEQPSNYPGIYVNEENKLQFNLRTIQVFTDADKKGLARTKFYLGEEFNADNLLVLAEFQKLDENGNAAIGEDGKQIVITARVTNYQVDGSAVDTSVIGSYTAQVNYRFGETVRTTTYNVKVRSSEFETTKNLVYVAGLKAGYKESYGNDSYLKLTNDGRILTTYCQTTGTNNFTLNNSDLTVQIVKNTVNGVATAFKTEYIDLDISSFTNDTTTKKIHNDDNTFVIDYSTVNTGVVGSYLVPITYNAGTITANGREVENIVKSFIVVDVIAPVVRIIDTNTYTVEASMGLPDFSAYSVVVQRQYLQGTTLKTKASNVALTNDAFIFEGFVPYSQGAQPVTFKMRETTEAGETLSFSSSVTVTASTSFNIHVVADLTKGTIVSQKTESGKTYYTEYIIENGVKAYNVNATNVGDKARTCYADGTSFPGFFGLDTIAKSSYIEVTLTKKSTFVLYIGTNGDDDRGFAIYNSSNEILYEDVATIEECQVKQYPLRRVYELEAGTYKIAATGSTVVFCGYIIGSSK